MRRITHPECGEKMFLSRKDGHEYKVMLCEAPYHITPVGFYNAHIDIPLYVSHLGKPANNVKVIVSKYVGIFLYTTPCPNVKKKRGERSARQAFVVQCRITSGRMIKNYFAFFCSRMII